MSDKDTGGPAFPVADYDHQVFNEKTVDETRRLLSGMTMLDYFAAKAMQSIISDKDMMSACLQIAKADRHDNPAQTVAEKAYAFANQMIKERAK